LMARDGILGTLFWHFGVAFICLFLFVMVRWGNAPLEEPGRLPDFIRRTPAVTPTAGLGLGFRLSRSLGMLGITFAFCETSAPRRCMYLFCSASNQRGGNLHKASPTLPALSRIR
jgi:hypothetical protein